MGFSDMTWYSVVQSSRVVSSIAGTVSFLEEAEFNEVMMVPSSDQLTGGKVGPAIRPG